MSLQEPLGPALQAVARVALPHGVRHRELVTTKLITAKLLTAKLLTAKLLTAKLITAKLVTAKLVTFDWAG